MILHRRTHGIEPEYSRFRRGYPEDHEELESVFPADQRKKLVPFLSAALSGKPKAG